ncbi:MOSC domain-containing protein [Caulobacter sp. SLTY]|uniref:MOSC domain-containing protein n=1 Tax=Caulobacter sp. SLTY TaxID=2683262 RepID=UPI001411B930|nr:MOSC domain-containing protein [Caulobacter sp. SLTY]NBB16400.1 MOSC domain-containing protein [Caulobacter sp. SLTY]
MRATVASLYRHPVKGFTPEPLARADLVAGGPFPCDRLYVVEDGPSDFDPAAPAYVPKMQFAVLAKIAEVAKARTAYDEATGVLTASAEGCPPFAGDLRGEPGRQAFAAWLAGLLGAAATGPLKVLPGPNGHRFMDHPKGDVSVINLASVRDLAERIGRPLDPLRFRANLYVEGWPAWAENDWTGRTLSVGGARAIGFKPIVRCAAIDVDPATGVRDTELPAQLFNTYGHIFCGLYLHVTDSGSIAVGDTVELLPDPQ